MSLDDLVNGYVTNKEAEESDTYVSSFDKLPNYSNEYVDERGFFGDTLSSLGRGALSLADLGANAYETLTGKETGLDEWAQAKRKNTDFFKPDASEYWDEKGVISKGWQGALESLIPSIGGALPGAVAGGVIGGSIIPVIGAGPGSIVGGILGTLGLFGAGTYGQAKKSALSQGLSEEEASSYALKQGTIEGGIEAASSGVEMMTAGVGKLFTKPVVTTLKGIFNYGFKNIAKVYAKTMATEVSTEILQAGLGAENAKYYGLETQDTLESMGNAILPAIFMSGIFATVAQGATVSQKARLRRGLRLHQPAAINYVTDSLKKQDPELATQWEKYAANTEAQGEKLDINSELTNIFFEAKAREHETFKRADKDTSYLSQQLTEPGWAQAYVAYKTQENVPEGLKGAEEYIPGSSRISVAKAKGLTPESGSVAGQIIELENEYNAIEEKRKNTKNIQERLKLNKESIAKQEEIVNVHAMEKQAESEATQAKELLSLNKSDTESLKDALLIQKLGYPLSGEKLKVYERVTSALQEKIPEDIQIERSNASTTVSTKDIGIVDKGSKVVVPSKVASLGEALNNVLQPTKGALDENKIEKNINTPIGLEEADRAPISAPIEAAPQVAQRVVPKAALKAETKVAPTIEPKVVPLTPESTTKAEGFSKIKGTAPQLGGVVDTELGIEDQLVAAEEFKNKAKEETIDKNIQKPIEELSPELQLFVSEDRMPLTRLIEKEAKESKESRAKVYKKLYSQVQREAAETGWKDDLALFSSPDSKEPIAREKYRKATGTKMTEEEQLDEMAKRKAGVTSSGIGQRTKVTKAMEKAANSYITKALVEQIKEKRKQKLDFTPEEVAIYKEQLAPRKFKELFGAKEVKTNRDINTRSDLDVALDREDAGVQLSNDELEMVAKHKKKLREMEDSIGREVPSEELISESEDLFDDIESEETYRSIVDTASAKVSDAKKATNAYELLQAVTKEVATNKQSAFYKTMVSFLTGITDKETLRNIKVSQGNLSPMYSNSLNTIKLSEKTSLNTALHEIFHGITVDALNKGTKESQRLSQSLDFLRVDLQSKLITEGIFTSEEVAAFKNLKTNQEQNLYASNLDKDRGQLLYSLGSNEELLTVGLTSKSVQEHLKAITVPKVEQTSFIKTMWDKLIQKVSKALGLNTEDNYTALQNLLEVTADLARIDRTTSRSIEATISGDTFGDLTESRESFLDRNKFPKIKLSKKGNYLMKPPGKGTKWKKIPKIQFERLKEVQRKTRATEEKAYALNRTKPQAVKDWMSRWITDFSKSAREHFEPVHTTVQKLSPKMGYAMGRMEYNISTKTAEYAKAIRPWLNIYDSLILNEQFLVSQALNNIDFDKKASVRILKEYGLYDSYQDVEKVLKDIHKRMDAVGLNLYKQKDTYFPRRVEDSAGLSAYLQKHPEFSALFDDILHDPNATIEMKQDAIADALSSGKLPHSSLKIPGSVKLRSLSRINSTMQEFYADAATTIQSHIAEANEAIETRAFIGKSDRIKVANKLYKLSKSIEKESAKKKPNPLTLKKLREKYDITAAKYDGYSEISQESVAGLIESEAPYLSEEDRRSLVVAIRSRLNQNGMYGKWAKVRDIGLISALGSPLNTLTQLGDFVWQVYKNGAGNVLSSIISENRITAKDFAMDAPLKEFQEGGFAKYVDKVLTLTKFKWLDEFAKGTSMESTLKKAESMNQKAFVKKYSVLLGSKANAIKVHNDILNNNITEDVKFFVFSDVSQFQPISLSEMPAKYLTAGNGRIFYTLKSYGIKALNTLKRESYDMIVDPNKSTAQGIKNLVKLTSLLVLANAGVDEIKDFLLGRRDEFSDHIYNNLLKLGFMSRYSLDKGFREGFFKTLIVDLVTPPGISLFDPLMGDVKHLIDPNTKATYKSLSSVPLFGKIVYSRFTSEGKAKNMANEKKSIYKELKNLAKAGRAITSDLRKRVNRYNKDAKDLREVAPITNKNLRNVRSRAISGNKVVKVNSKSFLEKSVGSLGPKEAVASESKSHTEDALINKLFLDISKREGTGDNLTKTLTSSFGVTASAISAVSKTLHLNKKDTIQKLTDGTLLPKDAEKIAKAYIKKLYHRAVKDVSIQVFPMKTQEMIIDAMYNIGPGVTKYKKFSTALKEGRLEDANRELLDTAKEGGRSVKGLAKRRAEMYNRATNGKKITQVVQAINGRLTYLDEDQGVVLTYLPSKGKHPKSKPGVIDIK